MLDKPLECVVRDKTRGCSSARSYLLVLAAAGWITNNGSVVSSRKVHSSVSFDVDKHIGFTVDNVHGDVE